MDQDLPEALRLADWLEDNSAECGTGRAAATELRRQHAEIERLEAERDALRAELAALRDQKPFAWACIWPDKSGGGAFTTLDETTARNYMGGASEHQPGPKLVPLYAAPVPQFAEVTDERPVARRYAYSIDGGETYHGTEPTPEDALGSAHDELSTEHEPGTTHEVHIAKLCAVRAGGLEGPTASLLDLGGMLHTGAPAVPIEQQAIDCRTCTYRTWSGSGQSYDCNAAAGMPLPYSHHEGQVPDWCPKEPSLP